MDDRPPETLPEQTDLAGEVASLRRELERLNNSRYFRIQNSAIRVLVSQFARGLALGFGTIVGASVLVSFVAYWLAQIDFVPIIGDWAVEIADEIREAADVGDESDTPVRRPGR